MVALGDPGNKDEDYTEISKDEGNGKENSLIILVFQQIFKIISKFVPDCVRGVTMITDMLTFGYALVDL